MAALASTSSVHASFMPYDTATTARKVRENHDSTAFDTARRRGKIGLLMLPLTATVGIGSLLTGWLVSRTRRVAIFPAIGQTAAAIGLVFVAFGSQHASAALGAWGLPAMLAVVAVFQGPAMPVAQVTVQSLSPPTMLGTAAASVQLSRSIGSAISVTVAMGTLFAVIGRDGDTAATFAEAIRQAWSRCLRVLPRCRARCG